MVRSTQMLPTTSMKRTRRRLNMSAKVCSRHKNTRHNPQPAAGEYLPRRCCAACIATLLRIPSGPPERRKRQTSPSLASLCARSSAPLRSIASAANRPRWQRLPGTANMLRQLQGKVTQLEQEPHHCRASSTSTHGSQRIPTDVD